jgi:hypothetical protein
MSTRLPPIPDRSCAQRTAGRPGAEPGPRADVTLDPLCAKARATGTRRRCRLP